MDERRVDLIAENDSPVPVGDLGETREGGAGVSGSGGIVRVAQQHGAGSGCQGGSDRVEVERPPVPGVAQRHPLDHSAGLGDAVVERRIHRRRDDDAVARRDRRAQNLDDPHHHVARAPHTCRVHRPSETALGECRVGTRETRVGRCVPGVPALHQARKLARDGGCEGEIGLGDEQGQHVLGIRPPLRARALA